VRSGMHLAHNSAKLKIFNLPKQYPVVKVRPFGHGRPSRSAGPAIRWSVSLRLTDQGSDGGPDTERRPDHRRAAVSNSAMRLELVGASGPAIQFTGFPDASEAVCLSSSWLAGGGDEETRTPDPLLAKEMLCQLSYVPRRQGRVVGDTGLEPVTSALSGQRSNQLS
jgi:hypothetical protein